MRTSPSRVGGLIALLVVLLGASLWPTPHAGAIDGSDAKYRVSRFVPTNIITMMQANAALGDVLYSFQYNSPTNTTSSLYDAGTHWTMEFGWKDVGKDCHQYSGSLNKAGYPPDMNIQVDWTEDPNDAVIWMADLNLMRIDTSANPGKSYAVWWNCEGNGYFEGDSDRPYFQGQVGSWTGSEAPWTTDSTKTYNYVPAENGHLGVPWYGFTDMTQTYIGVPWDQNWNFETSNISMWHPDQLSPPTLLYRIQGPSDTGSFYLNTIPQTSTHGNFYQVFKVGTASLVGPNFSNPLQYTTGSNTGFQVEASFRCPTWSPAYFGHTFSFWCPVMTYVASLSEPYLKPTDVHYFTVPADGNWYYIQYDDYKAQVPDDDVIFLVDNQGYPLDVDVLSVMSGL